MRLFPFFLLVLLFLSSCKKKQNVCILQEKFPNVLNLECRPDSAKDRKVVVFSDLGAWHGYAFPLIEDTTLFGFTGPYLNTSNLWMAKYMATFSFFTRERELKRSAKKTVYYPGKLSMSYLAEGSEIQQELIFVDSSTSLIRLSFKENAFEELMMGGELFRDDDEIRIEGESLLFYTKEKNLFFSFTFKGLTHFRLIKNRNSYNLRAKLERGVDEVGVLQQVHSEENQLFSKEEHVNKLNRAETFFSENSDRWSAYISSVLKNKNDFQQNQVNQRAAIKCLMTLNTNWKTAHKSIKHQGLFPSVGVWYFNGFWAWDSWKHAVALVQYNEDLAKDQVRTMFDYQDKYGMIADCIYADSTENNWRNTKPPLSAWAVWEIYKKGQDLAFVEEMFEKLKKYHDWWYSYRDHNKNHLCEFGSTDGTRIAAAWESGMDNAVRFDEAQMVKIDETAWSLDQESVDLNAYLYAEKQFLKKMAVLLKRESEAIRFEEEAETLKKLINDFLFDKEREVYCDRRTTDGSFVNAYGTEIWIPLWAGLADDAQARAIKEKMMNRDLFNTFVPFPTLAQNHQKFDPYNGYWRGPVWIDQAYFGIEALKNYGFNEDAMRLTEKVFSNLSGFLNSDQPIWENYHPHTGEGLNAQHFSWSAAHLMLLYQAYSE